MEGCLAVGCRGERGPISAHHWSAEKHSSAAMLPEDALPLDPRNWSRADVQRWLHCMAVKHSIPSPLQERFPMNGKGLCLMSVDMYLARVPSRGKLLYRDFQLRLARAMHQ